MKKCLFFILLAVLSYSCRTDYLKTDRLKHIHSEITIEKVKSLYGEYIAKYGITEINDKEGNQYTTIKLIKPTSKISTYSRSGGDNSMGTIMAASYHENKKLLTKPDAADFYIIFKNDRYYFSGFRYQAVISESNALKIINGDIKKD